MIIRDGTNNHEKYPPSALFLMTTLDPLHLHLALFVRVGAGRAERLLRSIAWAPLFFYVLPFCALKIVELRAAVYKPEHFRPPPLHLALGWPLWSV